MKHNMWLASAVFLASNFPLGNAYSQNSEALSEISQFASKMCEEVKQSGEVDSEKVKGQLQAGLSGLLRRFGNLGGDAEIERNTQTYTGVIQGELSQNLQQVRECKELLFRTLVDRLLPAKQEATIFAKTLQPGSAPTPQNACSDYSKPDDVTVMVGDSAFVAQHFPHTVFQVGGQPILTVDRHQDGSLAINLDLIADDGRYAAQIRDNRVVLNPSGDLTIRNKNNNSVIISQEGKGTLLNIDFLNPQVVALTGVLRYGRYTINMTPTEFTVNGKGHFSRICANGSMTDVVIGP